MTFETFDLSLKDKSHDLRCLMKDENSIVSAARGKKAIVFATGDDLKKKEYSELIISSSTN